MKVSESVIAAGLEKQEKETEKVDEKQGVKPIFDTVTEEEL